jgi:heptaprenyl diphosphate synthase
VSASRVFVLKREELIAAAGLDELLSELSRPAGYALQTVGKHLRSALLFRAAQAGPHPEHPSVRRAAIAVELFQLATLAHDDVVDDAQMRRGTETVGVAFGAGAAGFAGGLLFARALEIVSDCGDEPTRRFARAAREVCAGEIAEFHDLLDVDRTPARYRAAISGKTATLFELSAWLGAFTSGAPAETVACVARFGHMFGMAFQIADDILDLVGDPARTGKARAKDLEHGVYTLPVIYAMADDKLLRNALRTADGPEDYARIIEAIDESGGLATAIEDCLTCVSEATADLRHGLGFAAASAEGLVGLLERTIAPIARPASEVPQHA